MIRRYLILALMIILTLPDLVWALYNLVLGGFIYVLGILIGDKALKKYGFNLAFGVDQFICGKAFGQDMDIAISDFLGRLKDRHEKGTAKVGAGWLWFAKVVDTMFFFDPDHTKNSIEQDENNEDSVIKFHNTIEPQRITKDT